MFFRLLVFRGTFSKAWKSRHHAFCRLTVKISPWLIFIKEIQCYLLKSNSLDRPTHPVPKIIHLPAAIVQKTKKFPLISCFPSCANAKRLRNALEIASRRTPLGSRSLWFCLRSPESGVSDEGGNFWIWKTLESWPIFGTTFGEEFKDLFRRRALTTAGGQPQRPMAYFQLCFHAFAFGI